MDEPLQVMGIEGLPEVRPGDDLVTQLLEGLAGSGEEPRTGDILVVTQKIVSKAEGQLVDLGRVEPSSFALTIASHCGKDARLIEVVLRQSKRIVKMDRGLLIVETHHGFVCSNAGVDQSNVPAGWVSVLPVDPDASARGIRHEVKGRTGSEVAVIISDTFGRPWREGLTEVALGVSGLHPMADYRGQADRQGYSLRVTVMAIADELACAAGLVCGKTEGIPAALIRGYKYSSCDGSAKMLIRPAGKDMFR